MLYKKLYFFVFMIFLFPNNINAQMQLLGDRVLSEVSGQSGLSIQVQVDQGVLSIRSDEISLKGADQSLDLHNVTTDIDISTFSDDFHYLDIDVDSSNNTGISLLAGSNKNNEPVDLNIGDISICNKDIGSLSVSNIIWDNTKLLIIPGQVIGINLFSKLGIDEVNYDFNDTDSFSFGGIDLSESASGSPADPASWGFSGPMWLSLSTDTPDVINMQMQGNVRVADTPWGPFAIDGINVKYMKLRLKQ